MIYRNGIKVNDLHEIITGITQLDNSGSDMLVREGGYIISKEVSVGGTGAQIVNVLQLTGTVMVRNQWAEITEVTTLTNLTAMYATLYDGTNSVDLTANGSVLSGAPVGSFFTKDKVATETYTVNISDECRLNETLGDKKAGRPFIITKKNATNTYIRLHYTTTDAPVNFKVKIYFEYYPMNGGTLTFL